MAGLFSLLSALNFTLWYVALAKRTLKPFRQNAEVRFFLGWRLLSRSLRQRRSGMPECIMPLTALFIPSFSQAQ
nr:hypothetical protein [Klebsiella pneumoniae]